jgi:DNA-binding MarR family transcriptional regulator
VAANSPSIDRIPVLLRGAWFGMNRAFRERLSEIGITTVQYTALRCLHENKGLNQEMLASLMSTNKNNCSALLKRLDSKELIKKKVITSDRRNFTLSLTPKGLSLFFKAKKIAQELQKEVIGVLPVDSEQKLVSLLNKCTESISNKNWK